MLTARCIAFLRSLCEACAWHDAIFVFFLEFNVLNEVTVGILENYQLVCDYAVYYLLLLGLWDAEEHSCLVQLVHASVVPLSSI